VAISIEKANILQVSGSQKVDQKGRKEQLKDLVSKIIKVLAKSEGIQPNEYLKDLTQAQVVSDIYKAENEISGNFSEEELTKLVALIRDDKPQQGKPTALELFTAYKKNSSSGQSIANVVENSAYDLYNKIKRKDLKVNPEIYHYNINIEFVDPHVKFFTEGKDAEKAYQERKVIRKDREEYEKKEMYKRLAYMEIDVKKGSSNEEEYLRLKQKAAEQGIG